VCFPAWPWKFPTSPLFAEINSVIVSLKPSMHGPAVLLSERNHCPEFRKWVKIKFSVSY
jgi:hypothetical protein